MYVEPPARRLGVGAALLDAVITHAIELPGLRHMRLSVLAGNTAARRLYRSRGFVVAGVEPDVVRVGDTFYDEELLVLRLPDPHSR